MNHPLRSSAKREHIIMFQKWQKNLFSQNLQNLTKGKREQTKLTTIRKRNNRVFHQFFKTKFFYYAQNMRNILPFLHISFCFHFIYFLFYPFVKFFCSKEHRAISIKMRNTLFTYKRQSMIKHGGATLNSVSAFLCNFPQLSASIHYST